VFDKCECVNMQRKVVVTCRALFISLDQHTFRSFLFGCAALVWQHEKQLRLTVVLKQQVHLIYPASNTRDTVFPHVEDTFLHCGATPCVEPCPVRPHSMAVPRNKMFIKSQMSCNCQDSNSILHNLMLLSTDQNVC